MTGQLDFLLLLDSADRKICTYIEDESHRSIVENSFITASIIIEFNLHQVRKKRFLIKADTYYYKGFAEENISRIKHSEKNFFLGFQLAHTETINLLSLNKSEILETER